MEKLKITLSKKNEIEQFLLINIIGLMSLLENDEISICECESFLFSPYSVDKIKKLQINDKIIRLIELGCELEDVESLLPRKLKSNIESIKKEAINLLMRMPKNKDDELKKWID